MKTISICKFMSLYYGVALPAGVTYSHDDFKKEFNLKTIPENYVFKNEELVSQGKIIFVTDSFGEALPYPAPELVLTSISDCGCVEQADDDIDDARELLRYLSEMPTHQLRDLLCRYKEVISFYRIIKNELKSRGIYKTKRYKKEKELCKTKAFENPDKYERRQEISCKKIG